MIHAPTIEHAPPELYCYTPSLEELEAKRLAEAEQALAALAARQTVNQDSPRRNARRVQDLELEPRIREAFARDLGAVAVGQLVESDTEAPVQSIFDLMERAAAGQPEALRQNALQALFEGILSEGVAEAEITRDGQGRLNQHGHVMRDVLLKALERNPGSEAPLHEVTRLEGWILSAWDELDKAGMFDDGYVYVVPRLFAAGASGRALRKYGIFENLAVAWWAVWKRPDGTFVARSTFTAGVEVLDEEEAARGKMSPAELDAMYEARILRSYGERCVAGVYKKLGLPIPKKRIDYHRGFVIHKNELEHPDDPNADLAKWYDDVLGPEFFYGKKGERQDYVTYGHKFLALQRDLEPIADRVVAELMRYRAIITDEMELAHKLAKIGRKHVLEYVLDHPEIDARPLGRAATHNRNKYYQCLAAGDRAGADQMRREFYRTARNNMCGFAGEDDGDDEKDRTQNNSSNRNESGGLCFIKSKGCYCCPFYTNGEKRPQRMEVPALDDGERVWCLRPSCGAWFKKDGSDKNIGIIAKRAAEAEQRSRRERARKQAAAKAAKAASEKMILKPNEQKSIRMTKPERTRTA